MDDAFVELADKCNCIYSRYADDITLSGNSDSIMPSIHDIYQIFYAHHFSPNKKKTKISFSCDRQMVTGLTITDGVHVPKNIARMSGRNYIVAKSSVLLVILLIDTLIRVCIDIGFWVESCL